MNQIEACSLIAERIVQNMFSEEEIYVENEEGTAYTEAAQEKFDEIYDWLMDNVKIKNKQIMLDKEKTDDYKTEGFASLFPDYSFDDTGEYAIWSAGEKKKRA